MDMEEGYKYKVDDVTSKIAGKAASIRHLQKEFEAIIGKIVDAAPSDRAGLAAKRIAIREELDLTRAEQAELQRRLDVLEAHPPRKEWTPPKKRSMWKKEENEH